MFPTHHFVSLYRAGQLIQVDLMNMSKYSKENDDVNFLLCCICVFSKRAYVRALRNKKSSTTASAMNSILEEMQPLFNIETLSADDGSEWKGEFAQLLKACNIRFQKAVTSRHKAQVVERFQRTLRSNLYKYKYDKDTDRYIDAIQSILDSYNSTVHSSTNFAPKKVTPKDFYNIWLHNYLKVASKAPPLSKPKFNTGDTVKISKLRREVFTKGTSQTFTEEYFIVAHRTLKMPSNVYMYVLKDSLNNLIRGKFYEHEMTPVRITKDTKFKIDRVLKYKTVGKRKFKLVLWRGYPKEAASWIPA